MQQIVLREDQQQLKNGVYNNWNAGDKNVLAVLPTGGGKSIITSDIILDGHRLGLKECVMAHRVELTGQMSMHIANRGIKHRLIAPDKIIKKVTNAHRKIYGKSYLNPDASCAVAAVDTLVARADSLRQWAAQIQRWTIDEAHHVLRMNKWGRAVDLFPNAYGLGVTATPFRGDGLGLGRHHDGVFDSMVVGPDMRYLINIGALCDYVIARDVKQTHFDLTDADISKDGDYGKSKLKTAAEKTQIVGDVVSEYFKHAFGKRAICFATDVKKAGEIADAFNRVGIRAAAVSAETDTDLRNDYVERFKDGSITVLVNVDLFGEGFDVPACEVVIMARPTASLGLYLQMFGRALRTTAGKLYGLIIDHVGNTKRHGLPDSPRYLTLDRRETKGKPSGDPEKVPEAACGACSRPYARIFKACPYCGEPQPIPVPRERSVQYVDGDLTLLTPEMLKEMRDAMTLDSPADVGNRAGFAAGPAAAAGAINRQMEKHQSQQRLIEAIATWAGQQRALGRDDSESYRRFYHAIGLDVMTAQAQSSGDMVKIAEKVEAWS